MLAIIVNGLPASGKTTLGRALAAELGLPLFSKDAVKETLGNVLGAPSPGTSSPGTSSFGTSSSGAPSFGDLPPDWRSQLGRAAMETLWTLLGESPTGGIVEAPILAHQKAAAVEGLRRIGVEHAHEIWCDVPVDVARARYSLRGARHFVHPSPTEESWRFWSEVGRPLSIGPVHRVDTNGVVDVQALARRLTSVCCASCH